MIQKLIRLLINLFVILNLSRKFSIKDFLFKLNLKLLNFVKKIIFQKRKIKIVDEIIKKQ